MTPYTVARDVEAVAEHVPYCSDLLVVTATQ